MPTSSIVTVAAVTTPAAVSKWPAEIASRDNRGRGWSSRPRPLKRARAVVVIRSGMTYLQQSLWISARLALAAVAHLASHASPAKSANGMKCHSSMS